MKLDLSKPFDKQRAEQRFKKLVEKGAKIELTEFRQSDKTPSQHRYVHVCIGYMANDLGYSMDEAKILLKQEFAKEYPELGTYVKNGTTFLKSFQNGDKEDASLFNKEQCQKFIDWLIEFADKQGTPIPSLDQYKEFEFEVEKYLEHIL